MSKLLDCEQKDAAVARAGRQTRWLNRPHCPACAASRRCCRVYWLRTCVPRVAQESWRRIRVSREHESAQWLVVESLWAGAFVPAATWSTLFWLLARGPLILSTRALEGLERQWFGLHNTPSHVWKLVPHLVSTLVAAPAGLLIAILSILAIGLRTILPGQLLKNLIPHVETLVAEVVGDSVLFVDSPTSHAAMRAAVVKDLQWASARANRLIVVAHSQGASVTVDAMQQCAAGVKEPCPTVHALFTLGAAIGQLEWLKRVGRGGSILVALVWIVATVLGIGTVVITFTVLQRATDYRLFMLMAGGGYLVIGGIVGQGWLLHRRFLRRTLVPASNSRRDLQNVHHWDDLWATADPVSGGASTEREFSRVNSNPTWNRGDPTRDHTSYWTNHTEVVSRIVAGLIEFSPDSVKLRTASTIRALVPYAAALRHRRGRWVENTRLLVALLLGLVLWRRPDLMPSFGSGALSFISGWGIEAPATIPSTTVPLALLLNWAAVAAVLVGMWALIDLYGGAIWERLESMDTLRSKAHDTSDGLGAPAASAVAFLIQLGCVTIALMVMTGSHQIGDTFSIFFFNLFIGTVIIANRRRVDEAVRESSEPQKVLAWLVSALCLIPAVALAAAGDFRFPHAFAGMLSWAPMVLVFVGASRAQSRWPHFRSPLLLYMREQRSDTPEWVLVCVGVILLAMAQIAILYMPMDSEGEVRVVLLMLIVGSLYGASFLYSWWSSHTWASLGLTLNLVLSGLAILKMLSF